jgi:tRNA uridine 5-carboxymethylaminomethyl modification enzyme
MERLHKTRAGTNTLAQLLRRPEVCYADLPTPQSLPEEIVEQVENDLKYEGYVQRQEAEINRALTMESKQIPSWLNYEGLPSLRKEARQKLTQMRPQTIGQAGRIAGVTPADLSVLLTAMKSAPDSKPTGSGCDCENDTI